MTPPAAARQYHMLLVSVLATAWFAIAMIFVIASVDYRAVQK